jgi:hypothetical protein
MIIIVSFARLVGPAAAAMHGVLKPSIVGVEGKKAESP